MDYRDYEEGKQSSKYFFSAEKIHGRNKLCHRILGIGKILKIQVAFIVSLLKSKGSDHEATMKLTSNVELTLNTNDEEKCERLITADAKVIKI